MHRAQGRGGRNGLSNYRAAGEPMSAPPKPNDLAETLGQIARFSRADCIAAWTKAFNSSPPKYLSVPFMQRVLAHDLQCRRLGGTAAATRRVLKSALAGEAATNTIPVLTDGSVLVREWNGRVYRVQSTADGYFLDNRNFASLSAVARHITGAHWSGPRFFGLTSPRQS